VLPPPSPRGKSDQLGSSAVEAHLQQNLSVADKDVAHGKRAPDGDHADSAIGSRREATETDAQPMAADRNTAWHSTGNSTGASVVLLFVPAQQEPRGQDAAEEHHDQYDLEQIPDPCRGPRSRPLRARRLRMGSMC